MKNENALQKAIRLNHILALGLFLILIFLSVKVSPSVVLSIVGFLGMLFLLILVVLKDLSAGILVALLFNIFFTQYGRIDFPGLPDLNLYRVAFLLMSIIFFFQVVNRTRVLLRNGTQELMMLTFCSVSLISMIMHHRLFQEFGNLLSGYLFPFLYYLYAKNTVDSEERVMRFFHFAFCIGLYTAIMAILEHFRLYHLVFPPLDFADLRTLTVGQVRGLLRGPAATGSLLAMASSITIYLIARGIIRFKPLHVLYSMAPLMPIALFYTYERSAYLGLVGSLLVIGVGISRLRKAIALLLLLLAVIMALNWSNTMSSDRSVGGLATKSTVYGRIVTAVRSVKVFMDNPILGCGFGNFSDKTEKYLTDVESISYRFGEGYAQHNSFLGILSELGIAGFIPYMLILGCIFRQSRRFYRLIPRQSGFGKDLVVVFWGICTIYVATASFIEVRSYEFLNDFVFAFAGGIVGLSQRAELPGKSVVQTKQPL